jgi:hypothetical protein
MLHRRLHDRVKEATLYPGSGRPYTGARPLWLYASCGKAD